MQDQELQRYARHINLPHFGYDGQKKLSKSSALIIGLGGLGSPAALYLAASGVQNLRFVDHDEVELSNLQRQIAHTNHRIGTAKVISAKQACLDRNPNLHIDAEITSANSDNLLNWVKQADVVLDCSDNVATRQMINLACLTLDKPMVFAAANQFEGQLAVFHPKSSQPTGPCYACLYPVTYSTTSCSESGVLSPIVGIMGVFQALEAIKILTAVGETTPGKLHLFDGLRAQWDNIKIPRRSNCTLCGDKA